MNRPIFVYFDTFILSIKQLITNKLRSFLSLFGITVGIFCIIAILTAVDALKNDIRGSINKLGNDILYIDKWPWTFSFEDYPWWDYFKRPELTHKDYKLLEKRMTKSDGLAYVINAMGSNPNYKSKKLTKFNVFGITQDYPRIMKMEMGEGRYFSTNESNTGTAIAVIGSDVAEEVFGNTSAIDKEFSIYNKKVRIIGVIKKQGSDLVGFNFDKSIFVPYLFTEHATKLELFKVQPNIMVKASQGVSLQDLEYEIIAQLRSIHKLRPREATDFSVNEISIISNGFNGLLNILTVAGWIIGFFALIVGGFGIANIMYVSVSERTNIIGIKKALGAKRRYILFEFLAESIILCLLGGVIGIILVTLMCIPATESTGMEFFMSAKNITIGIVVSFVIGLLSGILPANAASKMNAVDAIRTK
jgi:putative ABC transport system permease protein